ncbi:hypothetical protein NQ317_009816 [Molorchus minor]|uniref:Uncharacterized protein n=1 Tax=Molorchus minor TaxID=1323400 RepID=A0ABQ9JTG6_9CUCU|nr:hypothetical protein NQ317_009816 [Molorchus minor]
MHMAETATNKAAKVTGFVVRIMNVSVCINLCAVLLNAVNQQGIFFLTDDVKVIFSSDIMCVVKLASDTGGPAKYD